MPAKTTFGFSRQTKTRQSLSTAESQHRDYCSLYIHWQPAQKEKPIQEKKQFLKDSDEPTEISPWLKQTQWLRHLEGQYKMTMSQLVKPDQAEEPELQEVEKILKQLTEKARQTVLRKKVSTFTLHPIESFQAGQDSWKPFHVNVNRQTLG
ncbi:MAG: hypothetical protein M1839_003011 [Geoglossum umbratile]|nr:MAG: hypothetical protein M1839_003011 [Geoglossum umbratile]